MTVPIMAAIADHGQQADGETHRRDQLDRSASQRRRVFSSIPVVLIRFPSTA
jgi:hypothetical protein